MTRKIDAIESEMSSEFSSPSTPARTAPVQPPPAAAQEAENPATLMPALSPMRGTTEMLLSSETMYAIPAAISVSEAPPVIEEAAILFANGQTDMVESVLLAAIAEDALGNAAMAVWLMLFDLYQISGDRLRFDSLSIEYAGKFETSPPSWIAPARADSGAGTGAQSGSVPNIAFVGKLDTGIVKLLEKAQNLAERSRVLRLEFARVTEVDPIGCGLLLNVLKKLQKSGNDLVLVGALELTGRIRAILEVGRRDETEAPWLLLLEMLRLLNLESEFEEASIDYCVTFEVSPPAFVAPRSNVTTAAEEPPPAAIPQHGLLLPALISEDAGKQIAAIADYARANDPAVLNCSQLERVHFSAAGQMLTGLAPLTAEGLRIEFHHVNHLVAALFAVMGLKDMFRIVLRKY